jgi:hypothetical protein
MNDMVTNRKNILKILTGFKNSCTFEITVPVLLPVRSAHGSFFFIGFTINEYTSSVTQSGKLQGTFLLNPAR